MFKSIREVNRLCQKPESAGGNLHARLFGRKVAVLFTWLLIHTPITANQTTVLYILIGIISGLLFLIGRPTAVLMAALFLQLWFIFDSVDGQVARYRKSTSITGIYLDKLSHYLIHPYIFVCIGCGLYLKEGYLPAMFAGLTAGLASVLMEALYSCRDASYLSVLGRARSIKVKTAGPKRKTEETQALSASGPGSVLKRVFSLWHTLCTYPSIMNIITLAAVLDFIRFRVFEVDNIICLKAVIIGYGMAMPLFWLIKISHLVITRKIETEFSNNFEIEN